MVKRSVSLLIILFLIIFVAACAAKAPSSDALEDKDQQEFTEIIMDKYKISLVSPGKGWDMVYDSDQKKLWREAGTETDYEILIIDGNVNPEQFRVDKSQSWKILNQQELTYDELPSPMLYTLATKSEEAKTRGTLQLYFSRSDGLQQPIYYIITLRNFNFDADDKYHAFFSQVLNSLYLMFD